MTVLYRDVQSKPNKKQRSIPAPSLFIPLVSRLSSLSSQLQNHPMLHHTIHLSTQVYLSS